VALELVEGNVGQVVLGRTLDRTPIIMLIADSNIRIIQASTGEIIRTLTINPNPDGGPGKFPMSRNMTPVGEGGLDDVFVGPVPRRPLRGGVGME